MKIPVAFIIYASNPSARKTLYLDELSTDSDLPHDEIAMMLAMKKEKIANELSCKARLDGPVSPFVRGTLNPEKLWTISVNDF